MLQIKDRLPDLKKTMKILDPSEEALNNELQGDELEIELDYKPYNGPVGILLKKYLIIHLQLQDIENHLINMKSMVTADHINDFNQKDFNRIRCESIKIGNDIIKKFKKLENKLPVPNDFSTLARMKRWLYYGFFHQYVLLWTKNEQFLMDYEQKLKKKLQIQSQILNCNLSDEDIETLLENNNTNLFISNILQDTKNERQKLQEIQDRFEDLKELEKSITEVHKLFISLQTLVAEQGDTIQCIENHFNATVNYVEAATVQLKMAVQLKIKKRFKCCCCC